MGVLNDPIYEASADTLGQTAMQMETGSAAFTTTATSESLKTRFSRIISVVCTPASTVAPGETIYWDQANTTDGYYNAVNVSTITVKRATTTQYTQHQLGSISATASFNLQLPVAGTITAVSFTTATAITANDTNYWTFGLVNKTQTLTAIDNTANANSTKATGGTGITAYTARALTLSGTAANLAVVANDVYEFTVTKASAATTMAQCFLQLAVSPTGTSGLVFNYLIWGQKG